MMRSSNPLVSVIIPVYNSELYLEESIRSVLAQTYQPLEILIINDGSTDGSESVARKFAKQTIYLYQSNQGAAAARNQGIKKSSGEFLAFLDADDLWESDKIAKQMDILEQEADLDMVFGNVFQFISEDTKSVSRTRLDEADQILPGYVPGTILIRKKAFLKVGLFSIAWKIGEFIDWYLKAMETGLNPVMLPDIVMRRRIHSSNLGIRLKDMRSDYVKIVKASLDRRRNKS
jgi:glycosyltransferase involved in cell wall biosynthesis